MPVPRFPLLRVILKFPVKLSRTDPVASHVTSCSGGQPKVLQGPDEFEKYQHAHPMEGLHSVSAFDAFDTTNVERAAVLDPGTYTLVVRNEKNLFESMTVSVKVGVGQ